MRRASLHRVVLALLSTVLSTTISFSQNGIVKGKIKFGKEVLQSATVSLGNKTVLTDHNGEFSFSIRPGTYTLIITHVGYKKIQQAITVDAGSTRALDVNMEPIEQLGEVVTLGSRSLTHRSNLNTPVPVDAFSSTELQQTGQTSLMQMLNFTAPSLNVSPQNAYEPVTLRGLYPDQVLILLNGTRYNNTAYINNGNPPGTLGRGAVTNDLNSIPFSAIEKIEILRDGASAQYGSDAVAGVINVVLKESTSRTSISLQLGQQYEGDGENVRFTIYHGISLNRKGFLNVSADVRYRSPTFRGTEYEGTVYYPILASFSPQQIDSVIALDNQRIRDRGFNRMQVSTAGNSKLASIGYLINGAYPIDGKTKLFWTGAINNASFVFRFPYFFPKATMAVNTTLFPDGFMGRIKPHNWNISGIAGIKGVIGKEIQWEYGSAYGINSSEFYSENTNNASQQFIIGKNAPTKFYTGAFNYQQLTNTIHFTKKILVSGNKSKTVNLDWGAELRFENFSMEAGEEGSWKSYDSTGRKRGGAQAALIVSPDDALNKNRNVAAAYADFEADIKNKFILNIAGRFEHYSDFGSNLAGKMAAKYKIGDLLSLRASVSNGFRAPAMQQRYWGTIYNGFNRIGNTGIPTVSGIFNNEHPVTKVFGVPSLEAEKSLNLSAGLVSTLSRHVYVTIDGYWIQVKNRVVLGGGFNRTNLQVDSLLHDPSLSSYSAVTSVGFFSNAINTRTQGVDVVLHGKWNFHAAQLTGILSANFTMTRLFGNIKTAANLSATLGNQNTLFPEEQVINLEQGQPRSKIILSLNYKIAKFGFILRNTRFGETAYKSAENPLESFSPKILTDFSTSYTAKSWLTVTAGINNIFDVYPDRIEDYQNTGEGLYTYPNRAIPYGYNGGYYYVNLSFNLTSEGMSKAEDRISLHN